LMIASRCASSRPRGDSQKHVSKLSLSGSHAVRLVSAGRRGRLSQTESVPERPRSFSFPKPVPCSTCSLYLSPFSADSFSSLVPVKADMVGLRGTREDDGLAGAATATDQTDHCGDLQKTRCSASGRVGIQASSAGGLSRPVLRTGRFAATCRGLAAPQSGNAAANPRPTAQRNSAGALRFQRSGKGIIPWVPEPRPPWI